MDFGLSEAAPLSASLWSRGTTAWVFPEGSSELSRDRAFHKDISLLSETHSLNTCVCPGCILCVVVFISQ